MAGRTSEYQEEYCKKKGRWSNNLEWKSYKPCSKSYEDQPVGGRKVKIDDKTRKNGSEKYNVCSKCVCAKTTVENERNFCCCACHDELREYPKVPVPSVHKLRYISENYMSADDWY